ncbi:MAG: hypothetical protein LBQ88_03250 [Treponema sp.]|jgi:hypothetical protein|nr:hypothetical protein [Treponema sp.]
MNRFDAVLKSNYVKDSLDERRNMFRDLWRGKPLARVPVCIRLSLPSEYTVRETFQNGDKQLDRELRNAVAEWELGNCTDAIPAMRPDVGCSCIAAAFGAQYYWGCSENQTPGIKNYILAEGDAIEDLDETVAGIEKPDIMRSEWLCEGFNRIQRFVEAGNGVIPVSLLDAAGGVNVAADLLGMTNLMTSFYLYPEAIQKLLTIIQQTYLEVIAQGIKAAGGEQNITTTDFVDFWFPEGHKGHVSDDISANISPDMYNQFSGPYHDIIFDVYGAGGLHNCGPNPCAAQYVSQKHSPGCIDLNYTYSRKDLPSLKKTLGGKAFIYLNWPGDEDPIAWFQNIVDLAKPDLLIVPFFTFQSPDEARLMYPKLRGIAEDYAKQINWYSVW